MNILHKHHMNCFVYHDQYSEFASGRNVSQRKTDLTELKFIIGFFFVWQIFLFWK